MFLTLPLITLQCLVTCKSGINYYTFVQCILETVAFEEEHWKQKEPSVDYLVKHE